MDDSTTDIFDRARQAAAHLAELETRAVHPPVALTAGEVSLLIDQVEKMIPPQKKLMSIVSDKAMSEQFLKMLEDLLAKLNQYETWDETNGGIVYSVGGRGIAVTG